MHDNFVATGIIIQHFFPVTTTLSDNIGDNQCHLLKIALYGNIYCNQCQQHYYIIAMNKVRERDSIPNT